MFVVRICCGLGRLDGKAVVRAERRAACCVGLLVRNFAAQERVVAVVWWPCFAERLVKRLAWVVRARMRGGLQP